MLQGTTVQTLLAKNEEKKPAILDTELMKLNGTEMVPELKSLMTDRNYDWECLSNTIVLT